MPSEDKTLNLFYRDKWLIPIKAGTKIPRDKAWNVHESSGRPVEDLIKYIEAGDNVGWVIQYPYFIIDVDVKDKDKDGLKSLADLSEVYGFGFLKGAPQVTTPSGGFHYIVKVTGDWRKVYNNWKENIDAFPGIDFLTSERMVLISPSVFGGKAYKLGCKGGEVVKPYEIGARVIASFYNKYCGSLDKLEDHAGDTENDGEGPTDSDADADDQINHPSEKFVRRELDLFNEDYRNQRANWYRIGLMLREWNNENKMAIFTEWSHTTAFKDETLENHTAELDTFKRKEGKKVDMRSFVKLTQKMRRDKIISKLKKIDECDVDRLPHRILDVLDSDANYLSEKSKKILIEEMKKLFSNADVTEKQLDNKKNKKLLGDIFFEFIESYIYQFESAHYSGEDQIKDWEKGIYLLPDRKLFFEKSGSELDVTQADNTIKSKISKSEMYALRNKGKKSFNPMTYLSTNKRLINLYGDEFDPTTERAITFYDGTPYRNSFDRTPFRMISSKVNADVQDALDLLFGIYKIMYGDKDYANFIQWIGFQYQRYSEKIFWSPSFVSTQGVGKTLLAYILVGCLGEKNAKVITYPVVNNEFSEWSIGAIFTCIDEVDYKEDHNDKNDVRSKCKSAIANRTITPKIKYKKDKKYRHFSNYMFNANENPIPPEQSDRRYFMKEFRGDKFVLETLISKNVDLMKIIRKRFDSDFQMDLDAIFEFINTTVFSDLPSARRYLSNIEITEEFLALKRAPHTDYKDELTENKSESNPYYTKAKRILEGLKSKYWNHRYICFKQFFSNVEDDISSQIGNKPRLTLSEKTKILLDLGYDKLFIDDKKINRNLYNEDGGNTVIYTNLAEEAKNKTTNTAEVKDFLMQTFNDKKYNVGKIRTGYKESYNDGKTDNSENL